MERFQVRGRGVALRGALMALLAVGIALGSAVNAPAESSSSLVLSGTVSPRSALSVSRQVLAEGLEPDHTGRDILVALVSEQSNSRTGYRIVLALVNSAGGLFEKPLLSTATLPNTVAPSYLVTYGGAQVVFTSGSAIVSNVSRPTSPSTVATELRVSREAPQLSFPDAPVDTLILSVEAR